MTGFHIFKSIGVGADWLVGNLWRKVKGKPAKSYKEIWNGDAKGDDLDGCGYNLFYVALAFIILIIIILLTK